MSSIETGKRIRETYRGENLYAVITDKSLSLSMTDIDDQLTLAGLDMIGTLVTMLLEQGVDKEEIAGRIFECSRRKSDLPGILSRVVVA